MGAILDALKGLKLWQIGTLAAVLAGGIGIAYGVYALLGSSGQVGLGEDEQLIPIQYGNLLNEVSVNGSLVYPERELLTFGSRGNVGEVLVEEGQQVRGGELLARLDSEAVAGLEEAVAGARVDLQAANEALAKARDPHTLLDLAQAEAGVANARITLEDARDLLADLMEPTSQVIAQAEATVASAQLALEDAQEALDRLLNPTPRDVIQAEAALVASKRGLQDVQEALDRLIEPTPQDMAQSIARVTDARLAVDNASTTLHALINGPSEEDIAKAQSQIGFAATSLENAHRDLKLTRGDWDDQQLDAVDSVATSFEGYRDVFRQWLGAEIDQGETDMDPTSLLELWGTDLATLFDTDLRFYDLGKAWLAQGSRDDPATRWNETVVYAWLNLYPGAFAATCNGGDPAGQSICVAKSFDDAWDTLKDAEAQLDMIETQAEKAVANAGTAIARAEESLADAQTAFTDLNAGSDTLEVDRKYDQLAIAKASLDEAEVSLAELIKGPDTLELQAKQEQVSLAQADLDEAEASLAEVTGGPDPLQLKAKQTQVTLAQVSLDDAIADLAEFAGGPGPLELEAKKKQVPVAEASLSKAEEDLAELRGSVDALEVALREAQVASAEAALAVALQRLESATLRAPWDAMVSMVNVEARQEVNANTPVFEVVDPTTVEVDGIVDEIDVLFIREGAPARVTMDALPDQVLEGTVSAISAAAQNQQGVVSYPIRVRVTQQGAQLPEGLSAVASVVIREELNVLLVPLQALYGTFEQPIVRVMKDGRIEERPVVLGNTDDFWAAVREGLAEGDLVVMQSQQATTGGFGFGRFAGGFRRFGDEVSQPKRSYSR